MEKSKYGLFTAITMITGVVIGSGIFFKSDDILAYTEGNMLLGVLVFCIAAVAIIFGCLTISQLATRTDEPGGIVAYAEKFVNMETASSFGWFQMLLYYPTLIAVVSFVSGMYVCQLFGWGSNVMIWAFIGGIATIVLFLLNTLSAKLGGIFQNASMIIKLIPLLIIAAIGLIFGDPVTVISHDIKSMKEVATNGLWITAFAPIAFSFDGWVVSTSVGHEIKNSRRNLPIALTIAPIIILLAYIAYFVGITNLVGPEQVLLQGNDSVYTAANMIFGPIGAKLILVFVTVSVLGTLNGLILGFIRIPYSLAIRNMLPKSEMWKKESKKLGDMPIYSAVLAFALSLIWIVVNYFTQSAGMPGDVSEISICVSYLNYIVLYVVVMKLAKKGEIKSKLMGYVVPALAIIGSLVILSGSITHPLFIYYIIICVAIMGFGYWYYNKKSNK